jgi:hypothetical protein
MVTAGWAGLAFGFVIAMVLMSFALNHWWTPKQLWAWRQLVSSAQSSVSRVAQTLSGMCCGTSRKLAVVSESMGAESDAFKRSMRRSLRGNTSLMFQAAVAILVLVLTV